MSAAQIDFTCACRPHNVGRVFTGLLAQLEMAKAVKNGSTDKGKRKETESTALASTSNGSKRFKPLYGLETEYDDSDEDEDDEEAKEQPLQQVLANGSKQTPTAKETVPEQTLEKKAEVSGPMQTATTSSAVPSVDSKTKAATENGAQHRKNGSIGPVVKVNENA